MTNRKDIALAIQELLDKSRDSKQLARSIAAYLLETRQTKDVGAILRDLETVRLNQKGVLEIHVTSAHRLSEGTVKTIKKLFDAEHIIIHEEQDPSLLGGVKVRAHDQRLDYSVRTRLQRLRGGV